MSLEFVIIPVTKIFKDSAYDLQERLHSIIKRNVCIKIDEEYNSLMYSRINDWQDKDYDIITIGPSYIDKKIISVRFNDKGSKPENMSVDDFIELINSFEDEVNSDDSEKEEESGCILM
jgi:threonyl-tRNA synthetase